MNANLIRKISDNTTDFEKKAGATKRKVHKAVSSWKAKTIAVAIGLGIACGFLAFSFYQISKWYDTHTVKFHTPVEVEVRLFPVFAVELRQIPHAPTAKEQERAKEEQIKAFKEVEKKRLAERVYQYVRFLESEIGFSGRQDGTHAYCQSIGKVNEIGYFPKGNRQYCFSSEEKQREGFMYEYNDRMGKGYTMAEFLCEWVSGTRQPMCKRSMEIGL